MKKILLSLATLTALSVAGCGGNTDASDPNTLVSNDFETLSGWLPEQQSATLSRDKAHSGRYSIKVDPAHDYSLGFNAALGQLYGSRVKKLKVSAWAFAPTADATASLVTALSDPSTPDAKPMLWEALELNKAGAVGKWVEVSKVITLPENTLPTSKLGFYVWRTGGNQPVYLDDLKVTVEP